jgi:hypothetical protein
MITAEEMMVELGLSEAECASGIRTLLALGFLTAELIDGEVVYRESEGWRVFEPQPGESSRKALMRAKRVAAAARLKA